MSPREKMTIGDEVGRPLERQRRLGSARGRPVDRRGIANTLALQVIAAGPLAVLACIWILFAALSPYFLTRSNLTNILVESCPTALIALGALGVVVVGSLDISLGATTGLCTIVGAVLFKDHPSLGWLVVPAMLATGLAIGAINALVIVTLRIGNAFIVTLGMSYVVLSLSEVASGGTQIAGLPRYVQALANNHIAGVPGPIVLVLAVSALLAFFLNRIVWGRWMFAVGGSSDAARRLGIPAGAVLFSVFVIASLFAAIAGVLVAGSNDAGIVDNGSSVLLAFAAVVIGGASLKGGHGKVWATLVGAVILGSISDGLALLNISPNWNAFAVGAVLIFAIGLDKVRNELEGRLQARQARAEAVGT